MFGKFFISFLFLGIVAVQTSPINSVNELSVEEFISIGEIINKINEIIAKIKNALGGMGGSIEEIIEKIKEKINEILGNGTVNEVIQKIIEIIKGMIGQVNDKVQGCIEEEMPEITEIAQESQQKTMECVTAAQDKVQKLPGKFAKIKEEGLDILKKAAGKALMCMVGGDRRECLSKVLAETKEEGMKIVDEVKGVVSEGQEISMEMGVCVQESQEETAARMTEVYQKIVSCVSSYEKFQLLM